MDGRARSGGAVSSPASGSLEVAGELAGGSFSTARQLSPPRTVSQYPVAAATTDSAIVAWGVGPFDRERLVYSVRPAGSSFTAPRTLGTGVLRNAALAGVGAHAAIAWIAGRRLLLAELGRLSASFASPPMQRLRSAGPCEGPALRSRRVSPLCRQGQSGFAGTFSHGLGIVG